MPRSNTLSPQDCTRKAEFPHKKINWAEVTCSNCQKKGHGRARCPEAASNATAGDAGMDKVNGGAATTGGWEAPANAGSAPAEWETAQPNDAFGGGGAGSGW